MYYIPINVGLQCSKSANVSQRIEIENLTVGTIYVKLGIPKGCRVGRGLRTQWH